MSQNTCATSTPTPVKVIEIAHLRRISKSLPTAWQGAIGSDVPAHIAYRLGELTISVGLPSRVEDNRVIRRVWKDILRISPPLMMAEIEARKRSNGLFAEKVSVNRLRQRLRAEARRKIEAEIRAANGERPRTATVWEVREWLEQRNANFNYLRSIEMAGGSLRLTIRAWN